LSSPIHQRTVKLIKETYESEDRKSLATKEAQAKADQRALQEEGSEFLGKREARGTLYTDEKIEILNPLDERMYMEKVQKGEMELLTLNRGGASGLGVGSLPADFFDDGVRRSQFVREAEKNMPKGYVQEYKMENQVV
jgi:hypothetical protein